MFSNHETLQKPIWGEIDSMLDAKLFIGRSPEVVERYVGVVDEKLGKYKSYVTSTETSRLVI